MDYKELANCNKAVDLILDMFKKLHIKDQGARADKMLDMINEIVLIFSLPLM